MNDITLKINNSNAELGDVNISLGYNIISPTQPDLRGLPSSYTIKIPKTNNNLRLIKEGSINTAILEVEYLPIISGELIINSSDMDYWNCTITSSDNNFLKELGSRSLKELKEFTHKEQVFKQAIKYDLRDTDYAPFALDYELKEYLADVVCTELKNTGNLLEFDGINDLVNLPIGTTPFNFTYTDDFSISMFVKVNNLLDNGFITNRGLSIFYLTGVFSDGRIFLITEYLSGEIYITNNSYFTELNDLCHLVFTRSGNGVGGSIYINGTLVPTIFGNLGVRPTDNVSGYHSIGSNFGSSYFNGYMKDFKVYNRILTQSEVNDINDSKGASYPITNLLANYSFNETSGLVLPDSSGNGFDGSLTNYPLPNVSLGVDNSWVDYLYNPILSVIPTPDTEVCVSTLPDIDGNQILNQTYKSHLKPKALNFGVISYGNFYRLPNKEPKRVDKNGKLYVNKPSDYLETVPVNPYPEIRPYGLSDTGEVTGTIPPVKVLICAKKRSDNTSTIYNQMYFEGYLSDVGNPDIVGAVQITAIAGDAQSWQLLDAGEVYEFAVLDTNGSGITTTGGIPAVRFRYLGYFNAVDNTGEKRRANFAIFTDELANYDLIDSLAYNDIPPLFNFYTILEKLFSQYGIVLKTDDYIYNKLCNEFLSYSGDNFVYNYKNHLGIAKLEDGLVHTSDNTFSFNCMRTFISSNYNQQAIYNAAVLQSGLKINSNVNPYNEVNTIGMWDYSRYVATHTKYDIYSIDGQFVNVNPLQRKYDKVTLFYTIPFYYETYHKKQFDTLIAEGIENGKTNYTEQYDTTKVVNSDLGLLENTTLSGNRFNQSSTTLVFDEVNNANNESVYKGRTNYGFGYRCADTGTVTMSIDFGYSGTILRSEWGTLVGDNTVIDKKKPVYLVVTKIKEFKDYETLDSGLTKFGSPLPNNETIVKYWDLTYDLNGVNLLGKQVSEIFNFPVTKGEVINMYVVFTGYNNSYRGSVIPTKPGIEPEAPTFISPYQNDYSSEMIITKFDVNIMLNTDYYIDVAKNSPDINQLTFFKDILLENRLLPYYDNISKTMTLKQFNDIAKDHIVLDKFNIEEADEFNVYNKNLLIGYSKDTTNQFNKSELYDYKYNTATNKDEFKYEFSYSKTENTLYKSYGTLADLSNVALLQDISPYILTTSYEVNPETIPGSPELDYNMLLNRGLNGMEKFEFNPALSTLINPKLGNKGYKPANYKQFKVASITSKDNVKLIGAEVNWSFDYNTAKVTLKRHIGLPQNSISNAIASSTINVANTLSGVNNYIYLERLNSVLDTTTFGKREFDSYFLENFKWFNSTANGLLLNVNEYKDGYKLNTDNFSFFTQKLLPIAQRGQYRFRNGLLTNEIFNNVNDNEIYYINPDEIQAIAIKDYDFVNNFHRQYGYNFEKEIVNNTLTIEGILPFTDYYKITNEGIVKVWFDNSWYHLLEVVKFDVESEQCTLKVVRKIYGD